MTNPERLAYYLAIREAIGEGNNQYVDDMYTSNDGRLLIVVAAVVRRRRRDPDSGPARIAWRFAVDGHRSDHMAVSPDGRRVVVSASTADKVHVLRVRDGEELGSSPREARPTRPSTSTDGRKILHASIGYVYTPTRPEPADPAKGERVFQVVDARTFEVLRRYDLRAEASTRPAARG